MKSFSLDEYEQLLAKSVVLEQDKRGIKVLQTPEGAIVKFFRLKRLFSSALLKSYASRFVDNARLLKELGIKAVEVDDLLYCKPMKRTLVFYQPIPGETLRTVLQSRINFDEVMERFIVFLANLHDKGVLFRSIHLNNVIVSEGSGALGLIDFADMTVDRKSLSRDKRLRNFRHLARYEVDKESIKLFGVNRFIEIYFKASQLPITYKEEFLVKLQEMLSAESQV